MIAVLGFFVGFFAAVPPGPINVYTISQALKRDFLHAFSVGLTTAILDAGYCLLAILGISRVSLILDKYSNILKITAFILLVLISLRLIKQPPTIDRERFKGYNSRSLPRLILVALVLYVSNPSLYAFWLAVASTMTSHHWLTNSSGLPYIFALACGTGAFTYYFLIARYVSKYKRLFKPLAFTIMLRGLGVLLLGLALYSMVTFFLAILS